MTLPVMFSGIQPTGELHLGNYLGAIRNWVRLAPQHESWFCIVDYHAITIPYEVERMAALTFEAAAMNMACGIGPDAAQLFVQSAVPEHTELAWVLASVTPMGDLERMTQYKDKASKQDSVSTGLLDYPVLMAADILIYDTDVVPVGADQKQHVEIARDIAEKFNRIYGETFKLPEPYIMKNVAVVPGIDGQKMSKSYGNTIPLFAEDSEIEKLVMSIVTDSSGGVPKNVYEIHKLFRPESELVKLYKNKEGKYKELKDALIADMKEFISPLREKRKTIASDTSAVLKILKDGGEQARVFARAKMDIVREKIGVKLY